MKTTINTLALALVCFTILFTSCKKSESNAPMVSTSVGGYVILEGDKYSIYDSWKDIDSSTNEYTYGCLSAFDGDTMVTVLTFSSLRPSVGVHSFANTSNDASMEIESSTGLKVRAIIGTCNVTLEKGKYRYVFTNVDARNSTDIFYVSGNILED